MNNINIYKPMLALKKKNVEGERKRVRVAVDVAVDGDTSTQS